MLYPAVRRSKSLEDERASKRNIIEKKSNFFKQQSKTKIVTGPTTPTSPQYPPLSPLTQSSHEKDWTLAPLPKRDAHSPALSTGGHRKKTLASSARAVVTGGEDDPNLKLVKSLDLDLSKETNILWNPVDLTTVRNTNYSPPMTLGQPRSPGPGSLKDSGKKQKKQRSELGWDDLPAPVQDACIKVKIDPRRIDLDMGILWTVSQFCLRKYFPKKKIVEDEHKPYANPLFLEATKCLIEIPEHTKSMSKILKSFEFESKGGFGRIYKAKSKQNKTSSVVAVKKLAHNYSYEREHNITEVGFLTACRHSNVANHINTYRVIQPDDTEELWIVMEYIEGGALSEIIKHQVFYDKQVAWVAREILKALSFLHSFNFAHRDLKSSNIMISMKAQVKLVDFGLCADFSDGPRREMVGSPFWIPPEMIQNKPHSVQVDIWSLGVILLECFFGSPPYNTSPILCMYKVATEGLLPVVSQLKEGSEARDFISKCLQMNPDDRATCTELLDHDWLHPSKMDIGIKVLLRQIFVHKGVDSLLI